MPIARHAQLRLTENAGSESSLEGHRSSIFPNGLRVLTEHVPPRTYPVEPMAKAYVWGTGFLLKKNYLARPHGVEHMLVDRSTPSRTGEEFFYLAESLGTDFNAEVKARYTTYYILPPRSQDHLLLRFMPEMLDLIKNALIKPEEVALELGSIEDEVRRVESDAEKHSSHVARGLLYGIEPAAVSEQGPMGEVRKLTARNLRSFRDRFYHPGNITLFATSSLSYEGNPNQQADSFHKDIVAITKRFFPESANGGPIQPPLYRPHSNISSSIDEHIEYNIPDTFLTRARQNDISPFKQPKFDIAISVLSRILKSQAYIELRMAKGFGYHAGYDYLPWPENALVFSMSFAPAKLAEVKESLDGLERRIVEHGVEPEKFSIHRDGVLLRMKHENWGGVSVIGKEKELRVEEPITFEQKLFHLRNLTLEDVNVAARYILKRPNVTVTIGPNAGPQP